jgi:hypothetical protein
MLLPRAGSRSRHDPQGGSATPHDELHKIGPQWRACRAAVVASHGAGLP